MLDMAYPTDYTLNMNPNDKGRSNLVSVITTPLGFFALSLLIVEGFLGIILIGSNLEPGQKFTGLWIGASLFVLIVIIVTALVVFKPESLIFGEGGYLEKQKMLGDPTNQLTEKELAAEPKVEANE
jgi:hypothetical protein